MPVLTPADFSDSITSSTTRIPFVQISSLSDLYNLNHFLYHFLSEQGGDPASGPQYPILVSPPFAGNSLGFPWWREILKARQYPCPAFLDCGGAMALALHVLSNSDSGIICRLSANHPVPSAFMAHRQRILAHYPKTLSVTEILAKTGRMGTDKTEGKSILPHNP